ncbi:alginate export family protein [Flavobacterium rhizosphaerae]|uniref:Alginate export family protein n=1 Tax=Flavobacterium rhizosphaerae TaxID=3163298 RepID=A0ABW8Z0W4_9FLAO
MVLFTFKAHAQEPVADTVNRATEVKNEQPRASYYVEAGSYGTKRETDPPSYVRNLGISGLADGINWLDAGLDYRVRSEYRNNDIRRPDSFSDDYPFLLKGKFYIGIKNIIDPLRLVLEMQDSDRLNSKYPLDNRDVNKREMIQSFAELYFKKALGTDDLGNNRPFMIRYGRQAFEFLDRRLIGQNLWRNTTNNFLGFRAALGQDKNDWQIDLLALRPIVRVIDDRDYADNDRQFGAAIGHWRKWSEIITIQPYYMGLKQDRRIGYRMIHSPGIRLYGWVYNTGWNYDVSYTYQFGDDGDNRQDAFMATAEVGYKFKKQAWKPRVSLFFGYVTGDKNPDDKVTNRFERFYGFARPWSSDDYIIPENVVTPKLKVEFEPVKGVKADMGYSFYWLASVTDRFNNLLAGENNRDKTGQSGTFLGHGFDSRIQFKPVKFIDLNMGYMHFTTGEFVQNRQNVANGDHANASNFAYLEITLNALDIFINPKK